MQAASVEARRSGAAGGWRGARQWWIDEVAGTVRTLLSTSTNRSIAAQERNGRLRLLGVEYLVVADAWNSASPPNPAGAPVLLGQHFQFVGSPNRYGLPAFYELHVWAWKDNPLGVFADYNPNVSCAEYVGDGTDSHGGH